MMIGDRLEVRGRLHPGVETQNEPVGQDGNCGLNSQPELFPLAGKLKQLLNAKVGCIKGD